MRGWTENRNIYAFKIKNTQTLTTHKFENSQMHIIKLLK